MVAVNRTEQRTRARVDTTGLPGSYVCPEEGALVRDAWELILEPFSAALAHLRDAPCGVAVNTDED